MIFLAAVCMHERSLKKNIPAHAMYFFKKEAAARQFFVLGMDDKKELTKVGKSLTRNGCHVSVEDSYESARQKVEKAMKFHRIEAEDEDSRPVFSDGKARI